MKNYKVFLTDDHNVMREGLRAMIHNFEGFECIGGAANGAEAIKFLEKGVQPDIMLIDLSMPIMDGYALTEWVRAHRPAIKMLVMTVGVESARLPDLLEAEVGGILHKDATPEELLQALTEVVAGNNFYSPAVMRNITDVFKLKNRAGGPDLISTLSANELEFVKLSGTSLTYRAIADKLKLTPNAVENIRKNVFEALQVESRPALAIYAVHAGLVKKIK